MNLEVKWFLLYRIFILCVSLLNYVFYREIFGSIYIVLCRVCIDARVMYILCAFVHDCHKHCLTRTAAFHTVPYGEGEDP